SRGGGARWSSGDMALGALSRASTPLNAIVLSRLKDQITPRGALGFCSLPAFLLISGRRHLNNDHPQFRRTIDERQTETRYEMVTLKQLCAELKVDPREARERLHLAVRDVKKNPELAKSHKRTQPHSRGRVCLFSALDRRKDVTSPY